MRISVYLLTAISFLLFAQMAEAHTVGWSAQNLNLVKSYEHPINDGAVSSIWGNMMPIIDSKLSHKRSVTMRERRVKMPYFKKGYLNLIEAWPIDDFYSKKPFIIFNPGVFGPLRGEQTTEFARRFAELGYHVIAFANPLEKDFVTLHSNFEVGNVYMQSKAIYEASRAMILEYKRAGRVEGKVRWVGISYGAFLTSILANLDANHPKPLGTKDITLLSPPFVLTESISLLDQLIISSRAQGYEHSAISMARGFWTILWLKGLSPLQAIDTGLSAQAKGILGEFVFKAGMANALIELDKLTGQVNVPRRKRERREWRDGLLFSEIFERYSPKFSVKFKSSSDNHLASWVGRLRGKNIQVRILSAKDDFINKSVPQQKFQRGQLIALPTGGHFGYRSLDWFDSFFEAAFQY